MSDKSDLLATFDPYDCLQIVHNPDGTLTRKHGLLSDATATSDPSHHTIPSKDISINQSNNVGVRLYLPRQALESSSSSTSKLPLIVYYHGGGFIIGSVAAAVFHNFCSNVALEFPAIVLSVKYRLAPEHRLPAAYEDAMEALHWIKTSQELKDYADLSSCFLMGSSAGGNIVYHVGIQAASQADDLFPLKIKGLILHQPFIGGVKRTESELRLMNNPVFPQSVSDLMWELSLPQGVDRDHEYSNPAVEGDSNALDQIGRKEWKVLITGWTGDPMIDRQIDLVKIMEQKGVKVKSQFCEGGYHGVDLVDATKTKDLLIILKNFVLSRAPLYFT